MTLVIDASVAAALAGVGPVATWARQLLTVDDLAAPHLLLVEAAHVFRRAALSGELPGRVASLAHTDLLALPTQLLKSLAPKLHRRDAQGIDGLKIFLIALFGAFV